MGTENDKDDREQQTDREVSLDNLGCAHTASLRASANIVTSATPLLRRIGNQNV